MVSNDLFQVPLHKKCIKKFLANKEKLNDESPSATPFEAKWVVSSSYLTFLVI